MVKRKNVEIDSTSGSRAYNRLDMQASQSLHMVLELYDKFNFEIIEDYYDDITILNLDKDPLVVSYYQMKTSDHVITIDSAIKKDWLVKMQRQMERPEGWIVKELGLITNTPLKVIFKVQGENGKSIAHTVEYKDPHTPFSKFDKSVQNRIINDIAAKCGIPTEEVDLSKFVHVHTTLSIERHRDIVEKEMSDFLFCKNRHITIDTVKGIYQTVMEILTKKQAYEELSEDAPSEDVRKWKGVSRDDFSRIIDKSILLSVPSFPDVRKFLQMKDNDERELSVSNSYSRIVSDSMNSSDKSFSAIFDLTLEFIEKDPFTSSDNLWDYALKIEEKVRGMNSLLLTPYKEYSYIAVLAVCILINLSRKSR